MKTSFIRLSLRSLAAVAILGSSLPAFAGDDGGPLKQAEQLVKQAWNPGGDPPSADDRTKMLKQAYDLTKMEPDHRLRQNRVQAMSSIQAALDEIKAGDSDKATQDLIDADRYLRNAIEIAESH